MYTGLQMSEVQEDTNIELHGYSVTFVEMIEMDTGKYPVLFYHSVQDCFSVLSGAEDAQVVIHYIEIPDNDGMCECYLFDFTVFHKFYLHKDSIESSGGVLLL